MKKTVVAITLVLVLIPSMEAETTPYLSPGITLSWDLGGRFIVSPKISIGIYTNSKFYNVTFGRSTANTEGLYPHFFLECQVGRLTPPSSVKKRQIFWGGALGITIPERKPVNLSFRCAAFAGYLLFVNVTTLFTDGIHPEVGTQFVLPIPLKRFDLGPLGG